jgi:transcriptional regulator of aromatic amino acid metabolism
MPPLRERLDDLSLLVSHFLRLFSNEMGMSPPGVTPEALALLEAYTFPGTNDNKHIKGGACRQCKRTKERKAGESKANAGGSRCTPQGLSSGSQD